VAEQSRGATRRLSVELPIELMEGVVDAAELSRRTVDQFVQDVLTHEIERWHAAFPPLMPPADFRHALEAQPAAASFFATASRRNRNAILSRIEEAKRPETRARRIEQAITMLLSEKTPYRQ
jgi:uncharacterized protein YdeI (YjbR/CyaY-like superfamily)